MRKNDGMRDDRRKGKRKRKREPVPVREALAGFLSQAGLQRRLDERRLVAVWPDVVGEKIARFSRALDYEDGVLLLEADNAVWRQELTLLVPGIIIKYNDLFGAGTVREIRWRRGPTRGRARDNQG